MHIKDLKQHYLEEPETRVDLSVATNLQSLTIKLNLYYNTGVVLSTCNSLIRTIGPRNFRLKTITFSLEVSREGLPEQSELLWEALDTTLFQIHQINGLLESVQIQIGQWIVRDDPDVFLLLQRYMHNCNNAGILHCVSAKPSVTN